ncbi:MAG: exo-alpha-sialidase [Phycisphaera sp. RhM]|nr:exo-alpha-sialidase [Phycisphaera sp. RhM]
MNPIAIATRAGRVHLIYDVEYMRCFSIHSDDDGQTWSPPTEITLTLNSFRKRVDWQAIATGPGHGIELSNGRLIVPVSRSSSEQETGPTPTSHWLASTSLG